MLCYAFMFHVIRRLRNAFGRHLATSITGKAKENAQAEILRMNNFVRRYYVNIAFAEVQYYDCFYI